MLGNLETIIGYIPGIIGRVTELHAKYYALHWNFDHFFEQKVATDLSSFISNYDSTKNRIWSLHLDHYIHGCIAVDAHSENTSQAHLRWFIVSEAIKGRGAGNYLLQEAIDFSQKSGFQKLYLWTFQGLDAARHLYEKFGFRLVEEKHGRNWGRTVLEQRFELGLA